MSWQGCLHTSTLDVDTLVADLDDHDDDTLVAIDRVAMLIDQVENREAESIR